MAGPLVIRSGAASSAAMIIASVVLPSPGGPDSSTWSGTPPRRCAARSIRASCSRTLGWPGNSSSTPRPQRLLGGELLDVVRVGVPVQQAGRRVERAASPLIVPAQQAQGGAQQAGDVLRRGTVLPRREDLVERVVGGLGRPAEADEGVPDLGAAARPGRAPGPEPARPCRPAVRAGPSAPAPGAGRPCARCRAPGCRATRSSVATARRRPSGASTASMARASRGPMPDTVCTSSNVVRSSSVRKP